jgi:formamidopyrimidine-DNA glycosylase
MPELPEVETVKLTLEPRLIGRIVQRAVVGEYRRCVETPDPDEFTRRLHNRRITGMGRRGKFILINFDSGDTATIHLRMTGDLSIAPGDQPPGKHLHLYLELDGGEQLRFHDTRKFGRWSLLTPEQYQLFDQSLGVEPFDPGLDRETFADMLQRRKRILKPLLLDQTFIAGIGNIYADEALFRARVHPRRRSNELSTEEAGNLLREIRSVLASAIEHRGTTLRDYRDGSGQPGENLRQLRIYSRAAGDPCPTCGSPIVRQVIGQRGTKLCPRCQPLDVIN